MTDRNLAGRGRDDSDLKKEPRAPSQSSSSGGALATEIGSEDEERSALGGDPEPTRVTKNDKVQPLTTTRADNSGAR